MTTESRRPISNKDLGRLIKDARRALHKTQTQAADEAGIGQSTWASLEVGGRVVSKKTLLRILDVVGIPFSPQLLQPKEERKAVRGICINTRCPANQILCVRGEYRFLPSLQQAIGKTCPHCREDLLTVCPNPNCRKDIPKKIAPFCGHCKMSWATVTNIDEALENLAKEIMLHEEYLESLRMANSSFVE